MKRYDITQELFGAVVFPGDPAPSRQILAAMEEGSPYNLTAFSMCAHNGTHIDAPFHFIADGKTVDQIPLDAFVGPCYVTFHSGTVTAEDAARILQRGGKEARRILIGGKATVSLEAAEVFAAADLLLIGNESQTVGPEDSPMAVHRCLLGRGIVLLEGIRLSEVPEGTYLLSAAPLNLGGADGAPCRAILIDLG